MCISQGIVVFASREFIEGILGRVDSDDVVLRLPRSLCCRGRHSRLERGQEEDRVFGLVETLSATDKGPVPGG